MPNRSGKRHVGSRRGRSHEKPAPARAKPAVRRAGSKTSKCLALLERPEGATLAELQRATGWKADSVRGFLAGTVKKKLKRAVAAAKEERGRVYRIAAPDGRT